MIFQPRLTFQNHTNKTENYMLRLAFLLLALILGTSQCTPLINPEYSKISGKWSLYKIGLGYPMPNSPSELTPKDVETLEIKDKTLTRTVNGIVTEKTKIEIKKLNVNTANPRLSLVFLASDTYSFLVIDESKEEINLYEKCPLGAELADGSTYFYKKQRN